MRYGRLIGALLIAPTCAALTMAGCARVPFRDVEESYDQVVEHKTVPLEGAEELRARIEMPAGELKLRTGSAAALDAEFTYSRPAWQDPVVEYSVESSVGVLSVTQPKLDSGIEMVGPAHGIWDIGLTPDVPLDLALKLGAGRSSLDLSHLNVRSLNVLTGAGVTTVDLSGPRAADVGAVITAGVGELTVRVPSGIGVRISTLGGGIGEFSAEGFSKDGDTYVNDAYASGEVKIQVTLHRGIGKASVVTVD